MTRLSLIPLLAFVIATCSIVIVEAGSTLDVAALDEFVVASSARYISNNKPVVVVTQGNVLNDGLRADVQRVLWTEGDEWEEDDDDIDYTDDDGEFDMQNMDNNFVAEEEQEDEEEVWDDDVDDDDGEDVDDEYETDLLDEFEEEYIDSEGDDFGEGSGDYDDDEEEVEYTEGMCDPKIMPYGNSKLCNDIWDEECNPNDEDAEVDDELCDWIFGFDVTGEEEDNEEYDEEVDWDTDGIEEDDDEYEHDYDEEEYSADEEIQRKSLRGL